MISFNNQSQQGKVETQGTDVKLYIAWTNGIKDLETEKVALKT